MILLKKQLKRTLFRYLNSRFQYGSLEMLFICGHMRSGSSLLVHILNTNPEILGYGETHMRYSSKSDYGKVAYSIFRLFNTYSIRKKFIMDKVLHTPLLEDPKLLNQAKTIFLIRKPIHSLSSILELNTTIADNPDDTFNYYVERLEWIKQACNLLNPEKWTFATYEELTDNSELSFNKIEQLLNLQYPLTQKYDTIWATGKKGIGDPSENIQAGRIIEKKKRTVNTSLDPFQEKSQKVFNECLNNLKNRNIYH